MQDKLLVLIIEDSEETAKLISINLTQRGMETVIATNGEEGIAFARKYHPDFITIDILMPLKSGAEVICELSNDPELSKIPFAVITNLEDADIKSNVKKNQPPPKSYLLKPVNFNTLSDIIKTGVKNG